MAQWHELKKLEVEITDLVASGQRPGVDSIAALRALIAECSAAPDAVEAICLHGARSILAQLDGDYETAIACRLTEAQMINRLYELEKENSTDGWTLQNYEADDLAKRSMILAGLKIMRAEQSH